MIIIIIFLILIHGVPKTLCHGYIFHAPCGHGLLVGVLDWITPGCLVRVVLFAKILCYDVDSPNTPKGAPCHEYYGLLGFVHKKKGYIFH